VKEMADVIKSLAMPILSWLLPLTINAEQPATKISSVALTRAVHFSRMDVSRAVAAAAGYLEESCDGNGRFTYSVDTDSGRVSHSYNIVRHAGTIYALAMLNRSHPDSNAASIMIRSASFMRANYVAHDARTNTVAIWSRPAPANREAELGAAGLGLVALVSVEEAHANANPLPELQSMGRFVLFLQKPDGSFYSKYRADTGPVLDWQSLYYPGEAILGITSLYELDHSLKWLNAAAKGLAYLAESRKGAQEVPPDHWALIATAKFLPYYEKSSCPVSRAELVQHAARICSRFLHEQIQSAPDARLIGGFDTAGRTTPTAIRLEGLIAALEFLPSADADLRARIRDAVERGVDFLLHAQIRSGPYAGGMPETALKPQSVVFLADPKAAKVRIDYVQHALCAWLRYEQMFLK
jgi:hypothetical protein